MAQVWLAVKDSLTIVLSRSLMVVPKILVALLIWWLGKYLIGWVVKLISKVDLGIKKIPQVVETTAKAILALVVLDYLGIGRTIIGALVNGLTLTIAIALGLAFGRALEGEAEKIVASVKKQIGK